MKAVFYARVSTQEEQQLKALPKQVEECRDCIKAQGWELVGEYIDEGKSGTGVKNRDEYRRLMDDIELEKFDVIVVKSQDRLQRSAKDWYLFIDKIVTHNVRLYMYLENSYYTTDNSLITGIKAILAEEYSRDLSKKLNNANKRRIEKALRGEAFNAMGSGRLYGFRLENCKYVVDQEQAKVVKLVFELYLKLDSVRKVRDTINKMGYRNQAGKPFSANSISRMLKNEHYKGMYVLNRIHRDFDKKKQVMNPPEDWVCVEDVHEAIVDKETWETVNQRLAKKRKDNRGKKVGRDIFSGKLFCHSCGSVMWRHKVNNYTYWCCSKHLTRGMGCDAASSISTLTVKKILSGLTGQYTVNRNVVKADVSKWLCELREGLKDTEATNYIKNEIKRLEGRKERLTEAYLDTILSKEDYKEKYSQIESQLNDFREMLSKTDSEEIQSIQNALDNMDVALDGWIQSENFEDQKLEYLMRHIKHITVSKDRHLIIEMDIIAGAIIASENFLLFVHDDV